ncbi:MAG: hypothetical protein KDC92_02820, partial [Bacteroidetes bacterium]|nr:hypothetical protein [Bacteroidota bacterium]
IVDDHLMRITHVIRGEEWLPSAPLHHLLYKFLGWEETMPKFAHLPLILKPDPSTYINKRTKEQFANQFAQEFIDKNEDVDAAQVQKLAAQIFSNPKDLNNALRAGKNDSGLQTDLKAFFKKAMYGKLSKRDGDRLGFPVFPLSWEQENITGYRESGYMPEAFVNILVMLGWNPGTSQEVFNHEELIDAFSLERVGKSGAKFDPDKARWFNQQFLRNSSNTDLANDFMPILKEKGVETSQNYLEQVCGLVKEKASFLADFWDLSQYFFSAPTEYDEHIVANKWTSDAATVFTNVATAFENLDNFTTENIETAYKEATGEEAGKYMQLLRLLVSGKVAGPALYELMVLLGT